VVRDVFELVHCIPPLRHTLSWHTRLVLHSEAQNSGEFAARKRASVPYSEGTLRAFAEHMQ